MAPSSISCVKELTKDLSLLTQMYVASAVVVRALVSSMATTQTNYFTLLGLPLAFEIKLAQLSSNYREAAKAVHPDKFASSSEQDKRLAVQTTTKLNQAYETLKSSTS